MRKKVTVLGSFVTDPMGRTPHLSAAGEIVKGAVFRTGPGSKESNQGVAAYKAGTGVTMITKLSRDAFADIALGIMNKLHMDTRRALYSETTETGYTLIMVDRDSSWNEIVVILGTCDTITDQEADSLEGLMGRFRYLLTQLETNVSSVGHTVDTAYGRGVEVILSAAPVQPVSDEPLGKTDPTTPNGVGVEILTGAKMDNEEAADRAADWLFSKGVRDILTILRHRGVYINAGERKGVIPACRAEVVNITGAGGASNGGLLAALAEGKDLWGVAGFANALATLPIQRIDTMPSMPVRGGIDVFMAANRQTTDC